MLINLILNHSEDFPWFEEKCLVMWIKRKSVEIWSFSFLDAVDEKEMIVVLTLLMGWCHRWFGIQWGKSQEQEGLHQVGSIGTILANAQYNAVAIQFLFCKLQERQEWLLAGLVRQCLGQSHIQDVVVVIQDRVPTRWNLICDVELDGDARRRLLRNDLRDEIVFIAVAYAVVVLRARPGLLYVVFDLLIDEWKLVFSGLRVISIGWILRHGVERCFARIINYEWRLIVIGSLFCYYIRSTTAALHRA